MNHKQKIGYILLGAFIMLIGMSVDNVTSPPATAQNEGEITCQRLTFVDETGKPSFYLEAGDWLSIFKADVYNRKSEVFEDIEAMRLTCGGMITNRLNLLNPEGKVGASMGVDEDGGRVGVYGKQGEGGASMSVNEDGGRVGVFNKQWKIGAGMSVNEDGGRVDVFNKQGVNRAVMSVNEYGNGGVSTWDKNGYRQ